MNKNSLDNYSTRALAVEFVERLRNCLTVDEIELIRRRNATPEYSDACATHDFIDANMVMNDAFEKIVGREIDAENGFECVFWNEAWDIAKREFLTNPSPHIAIKLRNISDHLQWLLDHRLTDPLARQEAELELANARALLAEWDRRQWDEKAEHENDLRQESIRSEEQQAQEGI